MFRHNKISVSFFSKFHNNNNNIIIRHHRHNDNDNDEDSYSYHYCYNDYNDDYDDDDEGGKNFKLPLLTSSSSSLSLLLLLFSSLCINGCYAIDCFRCTSFDGMNKWCEDPFHHNYSSKILQSPCWAGRKGRDGLYPATACIKLSGKFEDNGETMIVRDCALDSGSLTADTELVRMSHCGGFYFDNRYVKGCVQSCSENACNKMPKNGQINQILLLSTATILILIFLSK